MLCVYSWGEIGKQLDFICVKLGEYQEHLDFICLQFGRDSETIRFYLYMVK